MSTVCQVQLFLYHGEKHLSVKNIDPIVRGWEEWSQEVMEADQGLCASSAMPLQRDSVCFPLTWLKGPGTQSTAVAYLLGP